LQCKKAYFVYETKQCCLEMICTLNECHCT